MLFEGHGLHQSLSPWCWDGHPFNYKNNVNGIDGDPNKDGRGLEIHTLQIPEVIDIQKAYIKKVIDTVNDLDNVLYEIANESHSDSLEWQTNLISYIYSYQARKPKQHPILHSGAWGYDGSELWRSNAEAISLGWPSKDPNFVPYRDNPPLNDGRKIVINDTDHLWGVGGDHQWVWKSFTRGLNPVFMDPYSSDLFQNHPSKGEWNRIRKNMGYTLIYSNKMDLSSMVPRDDLCSTQYCLANPGKEYLVYSANKRNRIVKWINRLNMSRLISWITIPMGLASTISVDLSASSGPFNLEWLNPENGELIDGGTMIGGKHQILASPFIGDAVLYIKAIGN
jgi:hypothetical protein